MSFTYAHLDDVPPIDNDGLTWLPVRRALGVTAFGINGYRAARVGETVIEPHDEHSLGAGHHEELYLVVGGRATFTVDGETVDVPTGGMLVVPVGTRRQAVAASPDTTVLVIGGTPGSALPVSPFEHWYAAEEAVGKGDFARAAEIASAGLADWPEHGHLNYQIACYLARAGHRERALEHLRTAFTHDPRTREWARDDSDLGEIRDDPRLAG